MPRILRLNKHYTERLLLHKFIIVKDTDDIQGFNYILYKKSLFMHLF